jgi:putative ABC transport system permease protein
MSFMDLVRTVWSNLNRMRGRVALTAIGVIIGTAAVLVLVSLGVGLQRSATGNLGSIGDLTRITVVAKQGPIVIAEPASVRRGVSGGKVGGPSSPTTPNPLNDEALQRIAALEGVLVVTPFQNINGPFTLTANRAQAYSNIVGIDPTVTDKLGWKLASGTGELKSGQAIAGARIGDQFFDPRRGRPVPIRDLQGLSLKLEVQRYGSEGITGTRTQRITIVGVLAPQGENDYQLFMPLKDVLALNDYVQGRRFDPKKDSYNQAIVKTVSSRQVPAVQQKIREMGFDAYSLQDAVQGVNSFFRTLQAILGGIGGIALLVAAVGIANTLTMAIYERTKEIGLMKALGATNRDVMSIFLGEAGSIGFLGGLLGVLCGLGAGVVINLFAASALSNASPGVGPIIPPGPGSSTGAILHTPLWLLPFAVIFATGVGLVSGVYPALRAAALDPLRALKYE